MIFLPQILLIKIDYMEHAIVDFYESHYRHIE